MFEINYSGTNYGKYHQITNYEELQKSKLTVLANLHYQVEKVDWVALAKSLQIDTSIKKVSLFR